MPVPSKAAKQIKPPQADTSRSGHPDTSPESPTLTIGAFTLTSGQFQEFLGTVKQALEGASDSRPALLADSSTENDNEKKNRIRASKLEFKTVNEVWNKSTYKYELKESLRTSSDDDEYVEYIGVLRERFDSKQRLEGKFLDIKSIFVRDVLREVLKGVSCVSLREDKPSINPDVLFTYLPQMEAYREKNTKADNTKKLHLGKLVEFLKTHYRSKREKLMALLEAKVITFDLLQLMFRPNQIIYMISADTGKPRCFIFVSGRLRASDDGKYFELTCRYLTHDWKGFGEAEVVASIWEFTGEKKITSLGVYPLEYHEKKKKVVEDLTKRGQKFKAFDGFSCHRYEGQAFIREKKGAKKFGVSGLVMIDPALFGEKNPNYPSPRINGSRLSLDDDDDLEGGPSGHGQQVTKSRTDWTEEEWLLCSDTVYGFCLSTKQWAELSVDDVENITWNPSAFDSLAIPDNKKEVLMVLAESRLSSENRSRPVPAPFDDFIAGKGRGLNFLLHGPPGVGKTLTAEVISERLERPLYSVSAGELSLDAAELDRSLSQIFDIANRWNAVLLFDEADVFLAQRALHALERNRLVAIFLQKLEYFKGILFLTTNQLRDFDAAVLNRVHLQLQYHDLDSNARRKVWLRFLQMEETEGGPTTISAEELNRLVDVKLNGRQIKNTAAIAHTLAAKTDTSASFAHIRKSLEANGYSIGELTDVPLDNSLYDD